MLTRRTLLATAAALPWAGSSVAQGKQDDTTSRGFRRDVLARWGDAVDYDAPPFTPQALTREAAATQFGWDGTVLGVVVPPPAEDGVQRGVLAVAHPTAVARMMFPGGLDHPLVAAAAQGASLINLELRSAGWLVVAGGYQSRRLTASTLCSLSGPAAATLGDAIQGVLAVQSGCVTPWGTLLLAEGDPTPWFSRLQGLAPLLPSAQHAAAFGWMVELDPLNPQSVPAKRTALGRFPRSGAVATQAADGRAVVFMSDDRHSGHLFRYVSADPAAAGNPTPLDAGTLSVAVDEGGWSVRFARLPDGLPSLTATLDAAAQLGAAVFDSPAGMACGPNGTLLLTCRGTPARAQVDSLNPRPQNPDGHVLLFRPDGRDPAADVFAGEIAMLCGPAAQGSAAWISQPSTVALDATGGMWLGTEASGIAYVANDSAALRNVYVPPLGSAMGGVALTPDARTLLSVVRHPGDIPSASFDRPATRWPTLRPDMPPQTTLIGLSRG